VEKGKALSFIKGMKKSTKFIVLGIIAVICVIVLIAIIVPNKGGQMTTISEASLEKVIEINELATVDYTYNAIATAYAENNETIKYNVAYEGVVNAGIDFKKIDIQLNEEEKVIKITLPPVEIQDIRVDSGTLDYIFIKDKYETETISEEALRICKADLEKRVSEEDLLKTAAKENAVESIKALFAPWIEVMDADYTVEIN